MRYITKAILAVLLVTGLSYATTGLQWYELTSDEAEEPAWSIVSRSDTMIVLRLSVPGVYYIDYSNERRVMLEEALSDAEPGEPFLPAPEITFGIPSCDSVTISTICLESTEESSWPVCYPHPEIDYVNNQLDVQYVKDNKLYTTNAYYPENRAVIKMTTQFREQHLARVQASPVRYNPVTNVYEFTSVLEIRMHLHGASQDHFPELGTFNALMRAVLPDYDSGNELDEIELPDLVAPQVFRVDDANHTLQDLTYCDYLIVAGLNFYDTGDNTQPTQDLLDYADYIKSSYNADVVIARANSLVAAPEIMFDQLHDEIVWIYENVSSRRQGGNNPKFSYLLILGDETQISPFVDSPGNSIPTMYCDANYGKMDDNLGSDIPDVMVGRLPAHDIADLDQYNTNLLLQETCEETEYSNFQIVETFDFTYEQGLTIFSPSGFAISAMIDIKCATLNYGTDLDAYFASYHNAANDANWEDLLNWLSPSIEISQDIETTVAGMNTLINDEYIGEDPILSHPSSLTLVGTTADIEIWDAALGVGWNNYKFNDLSVDDFHSMGLFLVESSGATGFWGDTQYPNIFNVNSTQYRTFSEELLFEQGTNRGAAGIIGACYQNLPNLYEPASDGGLITRSTMGLRYATREYLLHPQLTQMGMTLLAAWVQDEEACKVMQLLGEPGYSIPLRESMGNAELIPVHDFMSVSIEAPVKVHVANQSYIQAESYFEVGLYIDDNGVLEELGEATVAYIAPNTVQEVTIQITHNDPESLLGPQVIVLIVDVNEEVDEVIESNNILSFEGNITNSAEGYPKKLPSAREMVLMADVIDDASHPGPEIVNGTYCYNINTGSILWQHPEVFEYNNSNTPLFVADIDYDGVKEVVTQYESALMIQNAATGVEEYLVESNHGVYDVMTSSAIPIDILPGNSQHPEHEGMELLVRESLYNPNDPLDQPDDRIVLYSINYHTGDIALEWSYSDNTLNDNSMLCVPSIIYPYDEVTPYVIIQGAEEYDHINRYLYIIDLQTGSLSERFIMAGTSTFNPIDQQMVGPTVMNIDQDMEEEAIVSFLEDDHVYILNRNTLGDLVLYDRPIQDNGEYDPPSTFGAAGKIVGNGGLTGLWGTVFGTGEGVIVRPNDNSIASEYFDEMDGYCAGQSLVSVFAETSPSILCVGNCQQTRSAKLLAMTPNAAGDGTYDTESFYLSGLSTQNGSHEYWGYCNNPTYQTWICDINDDNINDFVAVLNDQYFPDVYYDGLYQQENYVDVIEGTNSGAIFWGYPKGDEIGYLRGQAYTSPTNLGINDGTPNVWVGNITLSGTVTVQINSTLQIMPGTVITCASNSMLVVNGSIEIFGEGNAEVKFKSETQQAGDWGGIQFNSGSQGEMAYVSIADATNGIVVSDGATLDLSYANISNVSLNGLTVSNSNNVDAEDVTISECGNAGIEAYKTSPLDLVDITITNCDYGLSATQAKVNMSNSLLSENTYAGAEFISCADGIVNYCTFSDNGTYGVYLSKSEPDFKRCIFRENTRNGLYAISSSDAMLGYYNQTLGNTFYDNGANSLSSAARAEIYLNSSRPVFSERHNDIIDQSDPYLIYDVNFVAPSHSGKGNYFENSSSIPVPQWFYPFGCVDVSGMDAQANNPGDLDELNDDGDDPVPTNFDLAKAAEMDGDWENASDLYLIAIEDDSSAAALDGWVRCQSQLGVSDGDLIEDLDDYLDHDVLGIGAFWEQVSLLNRQYEFTTSIAELDTFVLLADDPVDSLLGLIGQLETYYQLYLAGIDEGDLLGIGDGGNSVSVKRSGKATVRQTSSDTETGMVELGQSSKSNDVALTASNTGTQSSAPRTVKSPLGLTKLGVFEYTVPASIADYRKKKVALLQQLSNSELANTQQTLLPTEFALQPAYPNPFNPVVSIPYALPNAAKVEIAVYNVLGQRVAQLVNRDIKAGYHRVLWNGKSMSGIPVSSGVYFVTMKAADYIKTQKIVLMK